MVQEIWFEKNGWPEKKVVLYHKSTFFQVGEKWLTRKKIRVCRTTFLKPLFYTFLEKWLQNKWYTSQGAGQLEESRPTCIYLIKNAIIYHMICSKEDVYKLGKWKVPGSNPVWATNFQSQMNIHSIEQVFWYPRKFKALPLI